MVNEFGFFGDVSELDALEAVFHEIRNCFVRNVVVLGSASDLAHLSSLGPYRLSDKLDASRLAAVSLKVCQWRG